MSLILTAAVLLLLCVLGYFMGRQRAVALAGRPRILHSLPSYYGLYVALWCGVPSLLLFAVWIVIQPLVIENLVISALPAEMQELSPERLGLVMNDVRNIASGDFSGAMAEPAVRAAAEHFVQLR